MKNLRSRHLAPETRVLLMALVAAASSRAAVSHAIDKQASAHGGDVDGSTDGFAASGGLLVGTSLYNPTYGARPDNTGHALMRYAGHADIDLIGRRLSVPLDVSMFTDRELDGAQKLRPTELDIIAGVTSTWKLGPGALEAGARFEHDRAVDREGASQSYVDVRTRYLYSLAEVFPKLGPALGDGGVSGWLTLGWFAYNPTYFARPDNTGRAFLRYALHTELSVWKDRLSFGLDGTFFTDREGSNVLRPTELDFTPEIIVRGGPFEVHLAYERDMPLDRGGLVQHFVYLLGIWNFSLFEAEKDAPFEERGQILSP